MAISELIKDGTAVGALTIVLCVNGILLVADICMK